MSTYHLEFLTPLFSRGSYDDRPEIRPPSIRGQLHWWFRALGGKYGDEKAIFGGIHGGATASRVVVRVPASSVQGKMGSEKTLPHKGGGEASPKAAFQIGTKFDLQILTRFGALDTRLQAAFDRAMETWLLLGTLGLRGTRAAGSFRWLPGEGSTLLPPDTFAAYEARCGELLSGAPIRFALLGEVYTAAEKARQVVSDTLGGRNDYPGQDNLANLHDPLGKIRPIRKTSPLRFRIVNIGQQYRIATVWDARTQVTGNTPADLAGIIQLLAQRKPALGQQLLNSRMAQQG